MVGRNQTHHTGCQLGNGSSFGPRAVTRSMGARRLHQHKCALAALSGWMCRPQCQAHGYGTATTSTSQLMPVRSRQLGIPAVGERSEAGQSHD